MTELEEQLTTALRALSPQFEEEQTRQAEELEALQQQVGALLQQVEALTELVTALHTLSR